MDESFIILGNAVRRARKQMKISQEKLAELIGVDYKTINSIENHKGNPTFEVIYKLIQTLKLMLEKYFTMTKYATPPPLFIYSSF